MYKRQDPSHYLGAEPSVDIEKATNGDDADTLFGPIVAPGDAITWTFVVTNDGPVPLADLTVGDDDTTVTVDCGDGTNGIEFLLPAPPQRVKRPVRQDSAPTATSAT